jgi:hypothetical protein
MGVCLRTLDFGNFPAGSGQVTSTGTLCRCVGVTPMLDGSPLDLIRVGGIAILVAHQTQQKVFVPIC